MKRYLSIIILAGLSQASIAEENLVKNGDFEKGSSSWRGGYRTEYETPDENNKVCKIDVGSMDIEFYQKINTDDFRNLTVKFKVKKSVDYSGANYLIVQVDRLVSVTTEDGKIKGPLHTKQITLPKGHEWNVVELNFEDSVENQPRVIIRFRVKSGKSGSISLDDIEVVGEK